MRVGCAGEGGRGQVHQPEFGAAGADRVEHAVRGVFEDLEQHRWAFGAVAGEQAGQRAPGGSGVEGERDPAGTALAEVAHGLGGGVDVGEQPAGVIQQVAAGVVRSTPRRWRCSSGTPSSCSSRASWLDSGGWVRCSRVAARVIERSSATATKYRNCLRSIAQCMAVAANRYWTYDCCGWTVKGITGTAEHRGVGVREFSYEGLPGRVVFAAGAARTRLAGEIERLGASRVLLVAGEAERPLAERLVAPLADRIAATFSQVRPHVPVRVAEQARALAAATRADAVLSVGGGSTTGTAKAIALTSGLPIVAVPTTYAGSEVTPVWGLTEAERKTTGTDPRVLPKVVVYDPELTVSLPAALSAASGLNAMAHCVEAFWAPRRNPISALAAEEGVRALAAGLPAVVDDGDDLEARSNLLYGAYLAGSAFAVAGSGLHHKICHVLGGAYDLPHAQTHAIVLPHVLAFNAPGAPEAAARIARALAADDPVAGLRGLSRRLGIPRGLRELGLREDQLEQAVRLIEPVVPADNPVPVDTAALRALLAAAWSGQPATTAATTTATTMKETA